MAGFDLATQPLQVRSAISLTGQYAAVDEVLTGRENLVMMARLRHLPKDRVRRRAEELLDQFGLGDGRRSPGRRPTRAACGGGSTWR